MERETKIIRTPNKHKVEIKSYITGREKRELRDVFLNEMDMNVQGGEPEIKEIKGSIIKKAENKAIEIVVVAVDGNKNKILDRILDMRSEDYDFVIGEINKVTKETDFLG